MWHIVFLKIKMESSPLIQSTLISLWCLFSSSQYNNCCKISSAYIQLQISAGPCGSWNGMGVFLFTDDIYPLIFFWKHDSFSLCDGECTYRTFFSYHVWQETLHCIVSVSTCYGSTIIAFSSQSDRNLAGQESERVSKYNYLLLQEETESGWQLIMRRTFLWQAHRMTWRIGWNPFAG